MSSEVERLIGQLEKQERTIKNAFLAFVSVVKSDDVLREVNALLATGDITGALDIVDSHIIRLSGTITGVFTAVGVEASNELASKFGVASVGLSFDPTDARTVNIMRTNRLQFIREVTESQRASTRQALTRAFETGAGAKQTATAFRDSLGLTAKQEATVERYRTLLQTNSKQALQRSLRDRRFDRSITRAIETGEPLSNERIDKMVNRYRERAVQFRSEVVARTEGVRATSAARDEALRQNIEALGVDESKVKRTWQPTNDNRTRDSHASMDGQTVGLNEPFTDGDGNKLMFPGDPSAPLETTAQCRCVLTFEIKS